MALGKIKADTLEHSTAGSLDTQFVVKGSAKVWASFSMSSFATRDSFNSSSLTDNATGDCRINLSSAMSNSNYAVSGTGGDAAANNCNGDQCSGDGGDDNHHHHHVFCRYFQSHVYLPSDHRA